MMIIAPQLSCPLEGGGLGGAGSRGWSLKKKRLNRNSDVRCGCSHKSISVRGVECEEQEKTWTVVWGSTVQEGQRVLAKIVSC